MAKKKTVRKKKAGKKAANPLDGMQLNVKADVPDFRDRMYVPPLIQLKPEMPPLGNLTILNQGKKGPAPVLA
jgi:hypothetical protein